MAPLILHNVPDEELYIGDDGIKRPYAMVFPQQEGGSFGRSRKTTQETGSFGKSTRRSRSKTGTPARREDPTIAAADRVFSSWHQAQNQTEGPPSTAGAAQRKSNLNPSSGSQASLGQALEEAAVPATSQTRFIQQREPTEIILRGYRSAQQQYAAINHFEQLAGRICEDYPREPPLESRRYKSELRDPAFTRRQGLTTEERTKVNRADGGDHWVKVTFESAEAAEAAVFSSPQSVLGHLVYAEPYHGGPPSRDEPIVDKSSLIGDVGFASHSPAQRRSALNNNSAVAGFARAMMNPDSFDFSPPRSQTSSRTADTTTVASTVDTGTVSSGTVNGGSTGVDLNHAQGTPHQRQQQQPLVDNEFCRAIPSVRKVKLLPVEQALLPAPSYAQRLLSHIPLVQWFGGSMIGNEVPRTDAGEFDWDRASVYWKIIWWLDYIFGLFGKEIVTADRDD
ncbi:hypothetical protein B0H67DRAFT_638304 [Lasiosphaeris hirsuta]|uniref:Nucleoporin NUP53 n=1 Tax=Lasiosphaeris hirsuta TaxID=260670 RepID=A0AA40B8U9_9PEZI|nr:hypothetical protein B0H67DRAFT_638304 [Lasiosphaeris hirsuta]